MKRAGLALVALAMCFFISMSRSAAGSSSMLDEVNAKIEKAPDDPLLYRAKAVLLMEMDRRDEGYKTAKQAMALSMKNNDSTGWFGLEEIGLGNFSVSVRFNMTATERNPPETGITRPLSFQVFRKNTGQINGCIEYEVGMIDGNPMSAAFRERGGKTYLNFNSMAKVADYEDVRRIALDLIMKIYHLHKPSLNTVMEGDRKFLPEMALIREKDKSIKKAESNRHL